MVTDGGMLGPREDHGLRAADDDRRRVADRLHAALSDGRLTLPEYDERVRTAYAARTYGELSMLLTDLPAAPSPPPARRTAVDPLRRLPLALGVVWTVWGAVLAVNLMIWVLASLANRELLYPWPVWVAGPSAAALFATTVGVQLIRRDQPEEPGRGAPEQPRRCRPEQPW